MRAAVVRALALALARAGARARALVRALAPARTRAFAARLACGTGALLPLAGCSLLSPMPSIELAKATAGMATVAELERRGHSYRSDEATLGLGKWASTRNKLAPVVRALLTGFEG